MIYSLYALPRDVQVVGTLLQIRNRLHYFDVPAFGRVELAEEELRLEGGLRVTAGDSVNLKRTGDFVDVWGIS